MAQRLQRAKRKLRTAGIRFDVPRAEDLPARRASVLATLYLIFNEGYSATAGDALVRRELCAQAIRLGRVLCELLPDDPEALALLALMRLHDSRRDARVDAAGRLVLLADQDRSRWDAEAIAEGRALAERALALRAAGAVRAAGADRGRERAPRRAGRRARRPRLRRAARRSRAGRSSRSTGRSRSRSPRGAGRGARADRRARARARRPAPLPLRPRRPPAPPRPPGRGRHRLRARARARGEPGRARVPRAPVARVAVALASGQDDPLARRAVVARGERVRQAVEADRVAGERAPVDAAARQQRERAVDLGGRVVKRAADVELVVVQRAGRQRARRCRSGSRRRARRRRRARSPRSPRATPRAGRRPR